MKLIQKLSWAVSAPILLFAGASHAVALADLTDPGCNGTFFYDSGNDKVSCQASGDPAEVPSCTVSASTTSVTVGGSATISASCNQPPIQSYSWTASLGAPAISGATGTPTFSTAGNYTYSVKATNVVGQGAASNTVTINVTAESTPPPNSSCPATPAGTTIVDIGGRDNYAGKDFDVVFDNQGSTFDSAVGAGEAKALKFTNSNTRAGYMSATAGNYGGGYKDWSLSLCPGDFTTSLGDKCVQLRKYSMNFAFSTDGSLGCTIPVNQPVYLNVRGTNGVAAGWVVQNLRLSTLP